MSVDQITGKGGRMNSISLLNRGTVTVAGMIVLSVIFGAVAEASLVVYDDCSSGTLSSWVFTPVVPQRTDPAVAGGALNWGSSANPGYGVETLVSTKNDFNLTATPESALELQIDIQSIVQQTAAGYDNFGMGWKDDDGDVLMARLYWQEDGAVNESIYRFYYNGAQLGTASSANLAIAANDAIKFKYDGTKLYMYRERAGAEATLYSLSWSAASFSGTGSVYLEMNNGGNGGAITLDNIATQTVVPEPATFGLLAVSSILMIAFRKCIYS